MSVVEMEGYSRWRIPSLKQLDEGTIYIPLDFYPHCKLNLSMKFAGDKNNWHLHWIAVLLEKGVIVGVEQGSVFRESLGFLIYKMSSKVTQEWLAGYMEKLLLFQYAYLFTQTHLFLHHILQHLLRRGYEEDAVVFGRAYERLIYFGHALEILLHTVLEEETDNRQREGIYLVTNLRQWKEV